MLSSRSKIILVLVLALGVLILVPKTNTKIHIFNKNLAIFAKEDKKAEEQKEKKEVKEEKIELNGTDKPDSNSIKEQIESKEQEDKNEKTKQDIKEKKAEQEETEVKIEKRLPSGIKIEMETEDGKTKTKIVKDSVKIEFKLENGKAVVKTKNEKGEEEELPEEVKNEAIDLKDTVGVKIKPEKNGFEIEHEKVKVKTDFPLSVNLQTKELIVATPAGSQVVAVLPQQAVDNMLRVGIVNQLASKTAPLEATATETAAEAAPTDIELTSSPNGEIEYKIQGVKNEKLLGIIPVLIPKIVNVSATTGQIRAVQQSFLSRLLDILSI